MKRISERKPNNNELEGTTKSAAQSDTGKM